MPEPITVTFKPMRLEPVSVFLIEGSVVVVVNVVVDETSDDELALSEEDDADDDDPENIVAPEFRVKPGCTVIVTLCCGATETKDTVFAIAA